MVALPPSDTCGMNAAYVPTSAQRDCSRRFCAMRKERLPSTADDTRFVSTASSNRHHQFAMSFVVTSVRTSSSPSAGFHSPMSLRFVVGYPASGSATEPPDGSFGSA